MTFPEDICRLCEKEHICQISILTAKVYENVEKYLPISVSATDPLPKLVCELCVSTLNRFNTFAKNTLKVEQNYWEQFKKSGKKNPVPVMNKLNKLSHVTSKVVTSSPSTSKAVNNMSPSNSAKPLTVNTVLQKLKSSNLTVKKVNSPNVRIEKMLQVEILDEALETNPELEDYVHYDDDTDEDDVMEASEYVDVSRNDDDESVDEDQDDQDYVPSSEYKKKKVVASKIIKKAAPPPPPPIKKTVTPKKALVPKKAPTAIIKLDCPATYVCMNCKNKFDSFEELKTHMETSQECITLSLSCDICKKVCESKKSLYQHKQSHNAKEQYVCDQCGKVYTNSFNLENHKSQIHGEYIDEIGCIYKCKSCDAQFENRKDLYQHMDVHQNEVLNLLCDSCGKNFHSQSSLQSHKRMHLDIRPYACNDCDKRFRTRLLLIQHTHVHTGIKLFKCDVCEKAFAKKGSLTAHYRLHSGETPYVCSICGNKFTTSNKLKSHYQVHKDGVPGKPSHGEEEYEIMFVTE